MTFATLGLFEPLLKTLASLGYQTPTPLQTQSIPAILAEQDLIATAHTGTGKTAGFALPLLQRLTMTGACVRANSVRAVILVPTRELAEQVHLSVRNHGQNLPLRTQAAYGGVSINPQMMALRKGADILVATPGRLLDLHRQNAIRFDQLQILVLDEADRMLDLGFAGELDALLALLPGRRQTLLFSATFSGPLERLAASLTRNASRIAISAPNTAASTIRQRLIAVDRRRKAELLIHLLKNHQEQALTFVNSRKSADQLTGALELAGISVEAIHGDKRQSARLNSLERFKAGSTRVLVATSVAARGLDIEGLPLVVNVDLPINAEEYVHRIGRTGRAGTAGEAISLVSADEVSHLAEIEFLIGEVLKRHEEPGFVPEHRVPRTTADGRVVKKPKKPKKPKIPGPAQNQPPRVESTTAVSSNSKIHLGDWLDEVPRNKPKPAPRKTRK